MVSASIHPRISVSGLSSINWTLDQEIAFDLAEGVSAIGIFFPKAVKHPAPVQAVREAGLRCACVTASMRGESFVSPRDGDPTLPLRVLQPAIDMAAELSAPCYFTASETPLRMPTDDAYDLLVPALSPVVEYARSRNVRLAIEPNSPATRDNGFIHTLPDAIDLSRDADIDICLELQNCWIERHLPRLFRENIDRFAVVQVSDYLIPESLRINRRVLGDGSMPLEWMLGLLLEAGYSKLFEIEVIGPAIEAEGYESAIRRSLEWLSERLVKWGVD